MMDGERRKAFFLDRDGVILKVRYLEPYPPETPDDQIVSKLVTIDQVLILPGVAESPEPSYEVPSEDDE